MNSANGKPQNRIKAVCFTAVFFVTAVLLIFSPILFGGIASGSILPSELYTFEQAYTEPDGTVARVYASGDSDFRYYHDGDGYILTADGDGYLRYAKDDCGRVEATGVRWNASSLQKSFIDKMTSEDIVRDRNPQLETSHGNGEERPSVLSDSRSDTVYNVVIFIAFADSRLTEADIPIEIRETFSNDTGTYNSLKSYFAAQTAGEKELVNLFAYESGAVFVYVSPMNRIYYSFTLTEDTRIRRERELLTSAVTAFNAADRDEVASENLDSDGDGYADAVSFVLLDRPVSTQGSILWPHKWHMASIGARAEICGVPIGVYSLNFTASHFVTFAHETGHVLGAPDYYAATNNGMPLVAEWDVMSITQRSGSPANMLAYTRKKYLGMEAGVIETVRAGQTVTLKNAADVRGDDVLAVRIPTDAEGVFVYAEYRARAKEEEFDGGQQSYGLVVYRVNENVGGYGNINARTVSDYSNIEVFVYRKGGANNLNAVYSAALNSKDKTDFNALGSGTDTPLTVNGQTVLDACFSDVWENGDGTVSFTVTGGGIKSDYGGQFTVKGAAASDWTYFAKPGERFTVDIGKALPTGQGTVRAFYDYDGAALTEISSSGLSKTFEVKETASPVETLTVRIRDEITSCQMKFAAVTDGREAIKTEIKQGTESTLFLGDGWETVSAIGLFGGEEKALKDIEPLAFNAWSGTGTRRVYFLIGAELYYYGLTVADRPVYMETEVEEISLLVGETLPEGVSATVHFASGEERCVSITECEADGFVNTAPGIVTVTLTYRREEGTAEVGCELKVSFARPTGAETVGTTTEFGGRNYPTAELISSDDGVTVNFGKTAVEYDLDYGTETVRVAAVYGESFSTDWITVDFVGGAPDDSGIFAADIKVYHRAYGRETVVAELKNIEFRILKSINRATIIIDEITADDDGRYTLYLEDRENWKIYCSVRYFDGTSETAAMTVADEDIRLDEPYEFAPEYLGHQTEGLTLLIRNTAVRVGSYDSVSYWGETLSLNLFAVMADGTERPLSGGDWKYAEGSRFDEYGAIGVAQRLTVEITDSGLLKKGGSVSSQISVTPIDGLKRIELADYKKQYEYGDENFTVRYLRTVYYSGRTEIVAPQSDEITLSGFDPTAIAGAEYSRIQTVTVGYSGKTVETEIEIINPVISVRPAGLTFDGDADAYLTYTVSARPFGFGLVYKNQATETVECQDDDIENYERGVLGKYAAVFNIRKDNRIICVTIVNVINCISDVRQAAIVDNTAGDSPSVISLRYGEAVNIGRFAVRYSTDGGTFSLNLGKSVAETATKNYSLKREEGGLSTVGVRVPALRDTGGKAVSFTVRINVAPRVNERMLSTVSTAPGVEIKHDGKIVVLQHQTTVAELMSILKSDYLGVSYNGGASDELAGGFSEAGRNRVFDTVELRNAEGTLIASYKVCLIGDADGDGRVSERDVSAFAKRILENSNEIYDHEAAGGSLNLKSFVKMIQARKEKGEQI